MTIDDLTKILREGNFDFKSYTKAIQFEELNVTITKENNKVFSLSIDKDILDPYDRAFIAKVIKFLKKYFKMCNYNHYTCVMNTPEELWDKYMEDTYILECLNVDLVVKRY